MQSDAEDRDRKIELLSVHRADSTNDVKNLQRQHEQRIVERFWKDSLYWPDMRFDFFLCEAVLVVGRMLLSGWRDEEAIVTLGELPSPRIYAVYRAIASIGGWAEFYTRPISGGTLTNLDESVWATEGEGLSARFVMGRIDPKQPFSPDPLITTPIDGREPEYVFVNGQDFQKALESTKRSLGVAKGSFTTADAEPADAAATVAKRGRPTGSTTYDWPAYETEAFKELNHHGGIDTADDPLFNQAALERHMADWTSKKWRRQPGESTNREHVVLAIARWREARAKAE